MDWRLVRWCGDPVPWEDPEIVRGLALGIIAPPLAEWFAYFNKWQRQAVFPGMVRAFGIDSGYSRSYQWGPEHYLTWMTPEDTARLLADRWWRWQFIDVTDRQQWPVRPRMTSRQWQELREDFLLLGPGRRIGGRLSAKQIAKEQRLKEQGQYTAERAERLLLGAERANAPRIHVVRR